MDFTLYLRFVAALALVLGLIGAIAWVARRYGFGQGGGMRRRGAAERRLAIVETLVVDNRRRLLLIQRDGVQHLVMTGAGPDLVIESGITAAKRPPEELS